MWKRESGNIMQHLLPHIVAITWIDALKEPRARSSNPDADYDVQHRMCSAFLFQAEGVPMFVTAGHVVVAINESIAGNRRLIKARIVDGIGTEKRCEPIPFPLGDEARFHIDRQDLGWDLGAIPIQSHWSRLLAKSDRKFFAAEKMASVEDVFDLYVVLGFPTEHRITTRTRVGSRLTIRNKIGTPLMPVRRLVRPPKVLKCPIPRFYGKLLSDRFELNGEEFVLNDIDGMSGGPVIGLKFKKASIEYKLVAVQSGWLKSKRVIAGCPLADLGSAVLQQMREHGIKV